MFILKKKGKWIDGMESVADYRLASLYLIMTLAEGYPCTPCDFSINPQGTSKLFQVHGTDAQLLNPHQRAFPKCPKPESFNIFFFSLFYVPIQPEYTELWRD